ncbi:MAG: hypothetical protein QNK35_17590 [Bacteroides sp.]|nr:hypothetical protein [Bacteroides sp.]
MKKVILTLLMVFLSIHTYSQKGDFGLGVILGNPTSLSLKYWTGQVTAIDASLGYRYGSSNDLYLNTDFLFHLWAIQKDEGLIRFYFGAGAGLGFISDLSLSVRVPLGAALFLDKHPVELFAEVVPTLQVFGVGNTRFRIEAYIGARWYF